MKKHINIPIFIPHLGCPNNCVFCNQRSISGRQSFDASEVEGQIEAVLSTLSEDSEREIAFFGGSFTGIDRGLMIHLLGVAKNYIDEGRVSGIRLSTRPDYIDREILDILSEYGVKTIELGLQSMDEKVLAASKRGHSVRQAEGDFLEYVTVRESGPDHSKIFEVEARLNSNVIGRGKGKTKREAEQNAAKEALKLFGEIEN